MSYAWTYTSGFADGRGNVVPLGANNARPSGWAYVDKTLGDDTTGDGSRDLPYRTILKGHTIAGSSGTIVVAAGNYTETTTPGNNSKFICDGVVIIDAALFYGGTPSVSFYSTKFIQGSVTSIVSPTCYDCVFLNANPLSIGGGSAIGSDIKGCVFYNTSLKLAGRQVLNSISNNTFHKCDVRFYNTDFLDAIRYNIYYQCNLNTSTAQTAIDYSIFWQCNYRFGSLTGSTTYYPSVPSGYVYLNTIADIRAANVAAFGAQTYNFNNCKVADPLFANSGTNDYTLSANSPAKHKSYYGDYIGAKAINYPGGFNSSAKVISILTRYGVDIPVTPIVSPPFIDCLGDSVTLALYTSVVGYPALLPAINGLTVNPIAEGGNTVYSPHGTEGNPSGNLEFYHLVALNKGYSGQYVSFCYGINDMQDAIVNDTWEATYKSYIQEFIDAGWPLEKLIIIVPPFLIQWQSTSVLTRFKIHKIARDMGIQILDVCQVFIDTGINDSLFRDGFHPNQTGQNLWAEKMDTLIKRAA